METENKKLLNFGDFDPEKNNENQKSEKEIIESYYKRRWGLNAILTFIFIPQLVFMFIYILYGTPDMDSDSHKMSMAVSQVVSGPIILLLILKFCKDVVPNFQSTLKRTDKDIDYINIKKNKISNNNYSNKNELVKDKSLLIYRQYKYLFILLMSIALFYVMTFTIHPIMIAIFGVDGISSANQDSVEEMINMSPILGFLIVVLVAPITEEMFARYGLFNIIEGKTTAALTSIILFAGMHVLSAAVQNKDAMELLKILPYFAGSIAYTMIYMMSDYKIAYPIILHSFTNCVAFIMIVSS